VPLLWGDGVADLPIHSSIGSLSLTARDGSTSAAIPPLTSSPSPGKLAGGLWSLAQFLALPLVAGLDERLGWSIITGTRERSHLVVMTILEAQVAPERWDALRKSYDARAHPPESGPIVESFLIQGTEDSKTWRIVTIWRDREALESMRGQGETPTGVLIFRDADAEPRLTIFTVWANPRAASGSSRE
jgi:hypothetical protein